MSLFSMFSRARKRRFESSEPTRLVEFEAEPELVYAIGDIHGMYDKFCRLEDAILADAATRSSDAVIVILGDFIDRGPDTNKVIDRLMAPLDNGLKRLCLSGNHEASMAEFLDRPGRDHAWLQFGGIETLCSYGVDAHKWHSEHPSPTQIGYQLDALVPTEHMRFVSERPYLIRFGRLVMVHAGLDPKTPLADQSRRDLLWRRWDDGADDNAPTGRKKDMHAANDMLVVHGHTPVSEVYVSANRINVDTGAYAGGPLSAVRLVKGRLDGVLRDQQDGAI